MPLTSTTRQVLQEADVYEITSFAVDIRALRLHVEYRTGVKQPDATVLYAPSSQGFDVSAVPYMTRLPKGAVNYYDNLKALLYRAGQDVGAFPAGAVT